MGEQEVQRCEYSASGDDHASINESCPREGIDETEPSGAGVSRYTYGKDVQISRPPQRTTCHCSHCLRAALGCVPKHDSLSASVSTSNLQGDSKVVPVDSTTAGLRPAILVADDIHACVQIAPDAVSFTPTPISELMRYLHLRVDGLESESIS